MNNKQLISYIKKQLKRKISPEEIRNVLKEEGWQEPDIDEAFDAIENPPKIPFYKTQLFAGTALAFILVLLLVIVVFDPFASPERNVFKMIQKMQDVTSLNYKGHLSLDANDGIEDHNIFVVFDGSVNIENINNPNISAVVSLNTDLLEGDLNMEARVVDRINYFKIQNLPAIEMLDIGFLKGNWIKLDFEEIKKQLKEQGFEDALREIESRNIEEEIMGKVRKTAANANIFEITKVSSDKINGKSVHRYAYEANKERLLNLALELNQIVGGEELPDEIIREIRKALVDLTTPKGELWIGKTDHLLYKITGNSTFFSYDLGAGASLDFEAEFSNHNKGVKVNTPADSKTIQELLEEALLSFLGNESLLNFENIGNVYTLSIISEQMENLKTEEDLYILNPNEEESIQEIASGLDGFEIKSNGENWCATINSDNSTWCVDNLDFSGVGECDANTCICK
ncbi:MAG: hypothetical protein ACOXZP_02000 [Minisyncoccales bacterium]|jgi:hypothetical protein